MKGELNVRHRTGESVKPVSRNVLPVNKKRPLLQDRGFMLLYVYNNHHVDPGNVTKGGFLEVYF